MLLLLLLTMSGSSCCWLFGNHYPPTPQVFHKPGCVTAVQRECRTPSGDWTLDLDYGYDAQGELIAVRSRYFTFTGYDSATGEFLPTRCERAYDVAPDGKLTLVSEEIRDAKTGDPVKRSFHEPSVKHWMTFEQALRELQLERQPPPS